MLLLRIIVILSESIFSFAFLLLLLVAGQTHPVTVHRIQARQTIESQVLVLQERRKRMYQDRGAAVLERVSETMTTEMLEMFDLDALAAQVAQAVEDIKYKKKKN